MYRSFRPPVKSRDEGQQCASMKRYPKCDDWIPECCSHFGRNSDTSTVTLRLTRELVILPYCIDLPKSTPLHVALGLRRWIKAHAPGTGGGLA